MSSYKAIPDNVTSLKPDRLSLNNCRCGGQAQGPFPVRGCKDRWEIFCDGKTCQARNTGQGLRAVMEGWNRLSQHFYR